MGAGGRRIKRRSGMGAPRRFGRPTGRLLLRVLTLEELTPRKS